jgi:NAD(P)H-hydrate epimerase
VSVVLTKFPEQLRGAAKAQWEILSASGITPASIEDDPKILSEADLVLDAMIGYSLKGPPRGKTKYLIEAANASGKTIISLDIPSGVDANSGSRPGVFIQAAQSLILALPKSGLMYSDCGKLFLADIGIPLEVYQRLGIQVDAFFGGKYLLGVDIVELQ